MFDRTQFPVKCQGEPGRFPRAVGLRILSARDQDAPRPREGLSPTVSHSWSKLVHHVETAHPSARMLQPAELKSDQNLLWSPGRGTDVWALIQACTSGDLERVRALIARDPSLARSHYDYRKPIYFAVRENHIEIVRFLLEHDRN